MLQSSVVLFVADLLHPVYVPAVNGFLNGDVSHRCCGRRTVLVLLTRLEPDHVDKPVLVGLRIERVTDPQGVDRLREG